MASVQAKAAAAEAKHHTKPSLASHLRLKYAPSPPPPSGIFHGPVPFPSSEYALDGTVWQHRDGLHFMQIYSGSDARDRAQGILVVATSRLPDPRLTPPLHIDLNKTTYATRVYRAPGRDGNLTIVSERGGVLRLRAEDGKTLRFDVSTRAYSSR